MFQSHRGYFIFSMVVTIPCRAGQARNNIVFTAYRIKINTTVFVNNHFNQPLTSIASPMAMTCPNPVVCHYFQVIGPSCRCPLMLNHSIDLWWWWHVPSIISISIDLSILRCVSTFRRLPILGWSNCSVRMSDYHVVSNRYQVTKKKLYFVHELTHKSFLAKQKNLMPVLKPKIEFTICFLEHAYFWDRLAPGLLLQPDGI